MEVRTGSIKHVTTYLIKYVITYSGTNTKQGLQKNTQCLMAVWLCWFPTAVVTTYHKFGALE